MCVFFGLKNLYVNKVYKVQDINDEVYIDYLGTYYKNYFHKKYPNYNQPKLNTIYYTPKSKIFIDRLYINHENDDLLDGYFLIQLPRHFQGKLKLKVYSELTILRPLCERNNNENYYNNYDRTGLSIAVVGDSCVHQELYKKVFQKGEYLLNSGGESVADPIFIFPHSRNRKDFSLNF